MGSTALVATVCVRPVQSDRKRRFLLRVSFIGSNKTRKVLEPFSVVDVRGPQVFQAVRRAKDVTIEDSMIGRLPPSVTDAFGCI